MNEIRLFKFSLLLRVFIIILQVIFNQCVPDHNADAFRLPYEKEQGVANWVASYLFDGFLRWDAQYFMHISLYGYTHENTLAFFPLFPVTLRYASDFLSVLPIGLSHLHCTLLAGVLVNLLFSSLASISLYKLTNAIFQSETLAFTSALLFCMNPASIFFSSLYSESLFAFLTFSGLYYLERGQVFFGLLGLSLSTGVRSNGALAAGFLLYAFLKQHVNSRYNYHFTSKFTIFLHSVRALRTLLYLVIFSLPFVCYQYYCYLLYCTATLDQELPEIVIDFVTKKDLKIPSEPSKWCYWDVPLSYSYVQSRYWDVGFLRYYSMRQIPNFLLALPILLIIIISCANYFVKNRRELWHLGLLETNMSDIPDVFGNSKSFPYFCHILFAAIFSTLFIHIQVLTRMLCSSSPVLYWVSAVAILPSSDRARFKLLKEHSYGNWLMDSLQFTKKVFLKSSIVGKVIFCYFLTYFFVGTFLHVNFFPWT